MPQTTTTTHHKTVSLSFPAPISTPSTSRYFKGLYGDLHVKLHAEVAVAVGQKGAILRMQLDACLKLRISESPFRTLKPP